MAAIGLAQRNMIQIRKDRLVLVAIATTIFVAFQNCGTKKYSGTGGPPEFAGKTGTNGADFVFEAGHGQVPAGDFNLPTEVRDLAFRIFANPAPEPGSGQKVSSFSIEIQDRESGDIEILPAVYDGQAYAARGLIFTALIRLPQMADGVIRIRDLGFEGTYREQPMGCTGCFEVDRVIDNRTPSHVP